MEAKLMDRIKAQLVRHEGLKLKPYRCTAGKLTIGIGRNLVRSQHADDADGRIYADYDQSGIKSDISFAEKSPPTW